MYSILPAFISALFLGCGVYAVSNRSINRVSLSFFFLCLTTSFWQGIWALLFQASDPNMAHLLVKVGYLLIIFLPTSFYLFIAEMCNKGSERRFIMLSYGIASVLAVTLLSGNLFVSGQYHYFFGYVGGTAGTFANFGRVTDASSSTVVMDPGGTVTNGSTADTTALISSETKSGVYLRGDVASEVTNFGTITGGGTNSAITIYNGTGSVTNGSSADTSALISGGGGVYMNAGTVTNFGQIIGDAHSGLYFISGGAVTNGSATDTTALIASETTSGVHSGVSVGIGSTTVTNFGTISSETASAIHIADGGVITNGSTADRSALIANTVSGTAPGIYIGSGTTTVTNFGTIIGDFGVNFILGASGTVINAGTIIGTVGGGSDAVSFSTGTNRLVVDPGASFVGSVDAFNSTDTLELATGTGTLGGSIDNGSEFSGFSTLQVDGGGIWTIDGINAIASVDNLGTVILGSGDTFDVTGSVATTSTGTFELNDASTLTIAANTGSTDKIQFLGSSGTLVIADAADFGTSIGSTKYKGPLIENFVVGDKIDLTNVEAAGATLKYSKGLLQVTDGTTKLATLSFQTSTLGATTFVPGMDLNGHLVISLS